MLKHTGDGHLLAFARPSEAVDAALSLARTAPGIGVALRAGVHTGEIEVRESGEVGGMTVHVTARISAAAGAGEVLVSRTVAELVGAGAFSFEDRGEHELKGVPGSWRLLSARS